MFDLARFFLGEDEIDFIIFIVVCAICGGLATYFLFISNKDESKYHGFTLWLHEFFNFKKLLVEAILKILYAISVFLEIFIGIYLMSKDFFGGIAFLVLALVLERILYEFILLAVVICRNTTDIRNKLCRDFNGTGIVSQEPVKSSVKEPAKPVAVVKPVTPEKPATTEQPVAPVKPVTTETPVAPAMQSAPQAAKEIRYCGKCGAKISKDDMFCSNCGQKIN